MPTLTRFEDQLTQSLQTTFGLRWFARFMTPAEAAEMALATNDTQRARIQLDIEARALVFVHKILHGALHAGIVTLPPQAK